MSQRTGLRPRSFAFGSLYAYRFGSGIQSQGEDGRYHRTADLRVTAGMIRPHGREAQLAFLSGAFARRSRDGEFFLVNAEHKGELIGRLLTGLGCSDVWVRSTAGLIPRTTLVSFAATAEVAQWLEHYRPARSPRPPDQPAACLGTKASLDPRRHERVPAGFAGRIPGPTRTEIERLSLGPPGLPRGLTQQIPEFMRACETVGTSVAPRG